MSKSRFISKSVGKALRSRNVKPSRGSPPSENFDNSEYNSAISRSSSSTSIPEVTANKPTAVVKVLQQALLRNRKPSAFEKKTIRAVEESKTKASIYDSFALVSSSSNIPLSADFLKSVSSSLIKTHVKEELGEKIYDELLTAAVGSSEDRWKSVSPEEEKIFALYNRKRLERYSEHQLKYNKDLGMTLEGGDNDNVSLIEYQLRKHTNVDMVPVTNDVLADLIHLDVSWSVALRLLQYSKDLRPSVAPSIEMHDRVTGLMTGYKSGGVGSRPWVEALRLYEESLRTGYETTLTTHAHALDALWRSNDSFHKVNTAVNEEHSKWILSNILRIKENLQSNPNLSIQGDEGCVYMESLLKAVAATGQWEQALSILFDMDVSPEDISRRLLVPTAEMFAFAMISCNANGNASYSYSLQLLFKENYSWRSLHSEVLLIYLQSLRNIVRVAPWVGAVVSDLVQDGYGLDRPCALACLQLLSSASVKTTSSKILLAQELVRMYDANIYIHQPLARKIELQTLFRCCYVIEARESDEGALMKSIGAYFASVFGSESAEIEWLADTEVYALQGTSDWQKAIDVYTRQVLRRPPEKVKFLPVPLRQVRWMCFSALVAWARSMYANVEADEFILDDYAHESEVKDADKTIEIVLSFIEDHLYKESDGVGWEAFAEILLLQGANSTDAKVKKSTGTKAMHLLALGSAASVSPVFLSLLSRTTGLTQAHLESAMIDEHALFRGSVLASIQKDMEASNSNAFVLDKHIW